MKKLIFLVIILAGAYYFYFYHVRGGGDKYDVVQRGNEKALVVTRGSDKLAYTMGPSFQETFMVFWARGDGDERADAYIGGIPLETAARIMRRYPDFHRCASAGAAEAKHSLRDLLVVTDKREVRAQLQRVAAEQEKREKNKGERLCVKLAGNELELTSWAKGDAVMSGKELAGMVPAGAVPQEQFYVDAIETMDCKQVM